VLDQVGHRVKVKRIHRESPRCAPGTLLMQCRLHKTKKHTVLGACVPASESLFINGVRPREHERNRCDNRCDNRGHSLPHVLLLF
jgi:hypothetical protein